MAVVDILGAELNTNMDCEVHVVFRGTFSELMVAVNPSLYQTFVSYVTGLAVMYIWLQKELYSCLKSALLLYEKLVGYLEAYGFKINPYGPCVSNNMLDRKQLTVFWHVDDLKISCVNRHKVKKMI